MDSIDKFYQMIKDHTGYIESPISFIYDNVPNPTTQDIIEDQRFIALHNKEELTKLKEEIALLKAKISSPNEIPREVKVSESKPIEDLPQETIQIRDVSELVDILIFYQKEELNELLKNENITLIKLEILKRINNLKNEIIKRIRENPFSNLIKLQEELKRYQELLIELNVTEQEEKQESEISYSRIIYVPSSNKSTYFLEDITSYQDRIKEIRLAYFKIQDGYFLKTKDTKKLEGYRNLYEYKNPNGIRILFTLEGPIINICSLFFKDKQRSIRITGEYEEAIRRYERYASYISNNLENPDFYIEQDELIGQINSYLEEGIVLRKEVD